MVFKLDDREETVSKVDKKRRRRNQNTRSDQKKII
jgi:hypothetical protein